jgi:hypothetical protein
MLALLGDYSAKGFLRGNIGDYIIVAGDINELKDIILQYTNG